VDVPPGSRPLLFGVSPAGSPSGSRCGGWPCGGGDVMAYCLLLFCCGAGAPGVPASGRGRSSVAGVGSYAPPRRGGPRGAPSVGAAATGGRAFPPVFARWLAGRGGSGGGGGWEAVGCRPPGFFGGGGLPAEAVVPRGAAWEGPPARGGAVGGGGWVRACWGGVGPAGQRGGVRWGAGAWGVGGVVGWGWWGRVDWLGVRGVMAFFFFGPS